MTKGKLLYIGDYGRTGFGKVSQGLLEGLHAAGWDITHLAINYNDLEPVDTPWRIVPAGFYHPTLDGTGYEAYDPFGFTKADQWVRHFDPDVVFINNDFPVVDRYLGTPDDLTFLGKHRSKKVIYCPLDSWPCPLGFTKTARRFDLTICYSYWQKDLMLRSDPDLPDMPVLYHGVDTSVYYPIPKWEAKKALSATFRKYNRGKPIPDFRKAYIVYFVGTNQWRKDIPALFRGYNDFRRMHPDDEMFLIPHTSAMPMSPAHGGWVLYNLRDLTGLENAVLMQNANIFTEEEMNIFYNAADVLAFPTRGEGFGLPSVEAMATKTPVIATRFGPQYEIHSDKRGYFIDVDDYEPGLMSSYTYFAKPSWRSLAKQLEYVYTHQDEAKEVAETAYEWVQQHTWKSKAEQLDRILTDLCQSPSSNPSPSVPINAPIPQNSSSVVPAGD